MLLGKEVEGRRALDGELETGMEGVNVAKRVYLVLRTCLLFVSREEISQQHTKIAASDDDSTKWQ